MRTVEIPKRNGQTRTVYVPSRAEKQALRQALPAIAAKVQAASAPGILHGFVCGRSPVTNARAHVGRKCTVTFDLRDFFASVQAEHLPMLDGETLDLVLVEGSPRQGLPTSPAVANLAALRLDRAISGWLKRTGDKRAVYTRYADDLTLSCDSPEVLQQAQEKIPQLVTRHGFQVAPEKTHVYLASAGRRMVTGVAVDEHGVYPTRKMRRRLRAARHQGHHSEARGLAEWCRLRLPRAARKTRRGRAIARGTTQTNTQPIPPLPRRAIIRRVSVSLTTEEPL